MVQIAERNKSMLQLFCKFIATISFAILASNVEAFVLLSGPTAAALDASTDSPDINFALSDEHCAMRKVK